MTAEVRSRPEPEAIRVELPPCPVPTPPVRADAELRYAVTAGRVRVTIDGSVRTYRAGEILIVPAGATHAFEALGGAAPRLHRYLVPSDPEGGDRTSGDGAGEGQEEP